MNTYQTYEPSQMRELIREKKITGPTAGFAEGFAQANLMIVKKELAFDFLLFCQRNPAACPLLDVLDPGDPVPRRSAPQADIRTDFPKYRIYRKGILEEEVTDITAYWEDDMVAFLIGCSFTFEHALMLNDIPVRHIEDGHNVPMYQTNIACEKAGVFHGPMVVSMRPIPAHQVTRSVQVTSRFPSVHGGPIHIGDPAMIGISDVDQPDFGEPSVIKEGEVPVFWACGVTPQAIVMHTKPDIGLLMHLGICSSQIEEIKSSAYCRKRGVLKWLFQR